jgi:hypothetical protein
MGSKPWITLNSCQVPGPEGGPLRSAGTRYREVRAGVFGCTYTLLSCMEFLGLLGI